MRWPGWILALSIAGASLGAPAPAAADVAVIDRIVAVVDGQPVTVGALRRRVAPYLRKLGRSGTPAWQKTEWTREALVLAVDEVIADVLIARAAEALDVKISGALVDATIDEDAAALGLSRAAFLGSKWEEGYVEADVRDEYRRRLLEGYAMFAAYDRTHDRSLPRGDDAPAVEARRIFRKAWRASLLHEGHVERRFVP